MNAAPAQPADRRHGRRIRMLISSACVAAVAAATAILPGTASADTTISSNATGTNNGYFYSFWEQASGATMTLRVPFHLSRSRRCQFTESSATRWESPSTSTT